MMVQKGRSGIFSKYQFPLYRSRLDCTINLQIQCFLLKLCPRKQIVTGAKRSNLVMTICLVLHV